METDRLDPHAYHHMQIYKDEASLAAIVARVVAQARLVGQPALVVATASTLRRIETALKTADVVVEATERSGIEMLDTHQVLKKIIMDGRPDAAGFRKFFGSILDRLCRDRPPCIPVIYADMADVLVRADNTSAALSMEILWNQLAADYKFSLLCGYAAAGLQEHVPSDKQLQQICDQHNYISRMN